MPMADLEGSETLQRFLERKIIGWSEREMGTGWFFNRDKSSFDNSWRGDESLEESDSLPDPDVLAQENHRRP
jgi:hypothetical protein